MKVESFVQVVSRAGDERPTPERALEVQEIIRRKMQEVVDGAFASRTAEPASTLTLERVHALLRDAREARGQLFVHPDDSLRVEAWPDFQKMDVPLVTNAGVSQGQGVLAGGDRLYLLDLPC